MSNREGEDKKTHFRSDRFFCEGGQWFFMTREGSVHGPSASRKDAEEELVMYLRDLRHRRNYGLPET